MKKILLIVMCLFLSFTGRAFAADLKNAPEDFDLKQKACQNIFSFINIDLSFMSPRAAVADVSVPDAKPADNKKGATIAISAKKEVSPSLPPTPPKNKTSLFRIDLLHIFKIQIL